MALCFRHSDSARGHTAERFAQQLRTTSILAAETNVSRLVIPTLARELSHVAQASVQERPPDTATRFATNMKQVGVQQKCRTAGDMARARISGRGGVLEADVECLRKRVANRVAPARKTACFDVGDDDKKEEELWAPALAVFRAVDAVLSGGGRSRISFVHRGTA